MTTADAIARLDLAAIIMSGVLIGMAVWEATVGRDR